MNLLWLDMLIFGNGRGLAAPFWDQPFYWLADPDGENGTFYTYGGGFGAQLTSFQWRHPRPQERRRLAGMEFHPFNSDRRWGRVRVSWAVRIGRPLVAEDFQLIENRLHDSMARLCQWGAYRGESSPLTPGGKQK